MLTTFQLDERDIEDVMKVAGVNSEHAIAALANNKNDCVDAIMDLNELNG